VSQADEDGGGAWNARQTDLLIGICGEQAGSQFIEFCHSIGMDCVSCFTFRVPIAG
jgi:pyruvate,orthophosphate dikinase